MLCVLIRIKMMIQMLLHQPFYDRECSVTKSLVHPYQLCPNLILCLYQHSTLYRIWVVGCGKGVRHGLLSF